MASGPHTVLDTSQSATSQCSTGTSLWNLLGVLQASSLCNPMQDSEFPRKTHPLVLGRLWVCRSWNAGSFQLGNRSLSNLQGARAVSLVKIQGSADSCSVAAAPQGQFSWLIPGAWQDVRAPVPKGLWLCREQKIP